MRISSVVRSILLPLLSFAFAAAGAAAADAPAAPPAAPAPAAPAAMTLPALTADSVSANVPPQGRMLGVNLAGAEFGAKRGQPGVHARNYIYPGAKQFDWCKAKGLTVIRLPFLWERMQHTLMGPLDEAELARMDAVVALARERGLSLNLDCHNYAAYEGNIIGTPETPNAAFADFWKKMADHYKDETAVWAYGIMNEPHGTKGLWPAAAQAAVDAIRSVDMKHTITVCGDAFAGAHSWKKYNRDLVLKDPARNLLYEAHQYFDHDNSGRYGKNFDDSRATPTTGVARLKPFLEWLAEHDARGFIGEFGVPDDDPRWLEVLDNFIGAMKAAGLGGTYWAAGPWWGKNPLAVEPRGGVDRPQMEVLDLYAGLRTKPADAKPAYLEAAAKARASAPPPGVPKGPLPPGTEKRVWDVAAKGESYHYANEGTEFASATADDAGRNARKITYRHQGATAYMGVGLYFGGLDPRGYSAFRLAARADKPCSLEVKAYQDGDVRTAGRVAVTAEWQDLVIPFASLKGSAEGATFDSSRKLIKIEFQPDADRAGNVLYLGAMKLLAQ